MKNILNRGEDGSAQVDGFKVKVPQTVSALSIIGTNTIYDGDDFQEDGYVYNNNQKRKWFRACSRFGIKRLWVGRENNLKYWYALLCKLNTKINTVRDKQRDLVKPYKNGTEFKLYAKPTHKFDSYGKDYWVYDFRKDEDGKFSYGFNWITKPKNLNGQRFYELEQRVQYFGKYRFAVENYFIDCVKSKLQKPTDISFVEVSVGKFNLIFKSKTSNYEHFWWEFDSFGSVKQLNFTKHI